MPGTVGTRFSTEDSQPMFKRILLALGLAASLGGAVLACNTPAGTSTPATLSPSTAPISSDAPSASDMMSAEPSAS